MKNKEVCEAFLNRESAMGSNLYSDGHKLFSYSTCIAEWEGYDNKLYVNSTKYSVTTSIHQSYLRNSLSRIWNIEVKYVTNIPKGATSIKTF